MPQLNYNPNYTSSQNGELYLVVNPDGSINVDRYRILKTIVVF